MVACDNNIFLLQIVVFFVRALNLTVNSTNILTAFQIIHRSIVLKITSNELIKSRPLITSTTKSTDEINSDLSIRVGRDSPKIQRLIDWNVSISQALLGEIVVHRHSIPECLPKKDVIESVTKKQKNVGDEVVEKLSMPDYCSTNIRRSSSNLNIQIDPEVTEQLRNCITQISSFYDAGNGFHNFEHASHVIMSTVKLLQRIASPDVKKKDCETEQEYHHYTFGISSDHLTQFAIVFSALIHDVDRRGVPNGQLSKEKDPMVEMYNNQSILEQHSLDLAWSLLEESSFAELRTCIFRTQDEYKRFRQLSVKCVIATDIFDKEMTSFRDIRWEKAFGLKCPKKATIIIECIIQSSDVSHTM
jgi:hypothetical protein